MKWIKNPKVLGPAIAAAVLGMLAGWGGDPKANPSAPPEPSSGTDANFVSTTSVRFRDKDDHKSHHFPDTAFAYAKMVEPELGVPPRVDLGKSVEIPLYVDGVQTYGNLGVSCDNPTRLGKNTISGSTLQRYEGRTADGKPLPHVVWVSFGRNSSESHKHAFGSVQLIGYNKKTGATAFFESSDKIDPWVTLDKHTLRMRGVMPWIDDPEEFNRAYVPPGHVQCVECHQADPFITNTFINAAKIPGTQENVVPILDRDSPYYVIGGKNWDMRTIHIEGNACFDCHRVGMSTLNLFVQNGWDPNQHMPPHDPGSLAKDLRVLLDVWKKGPENVPSAQWIIPPARGKGRQVVGEDYPYKASFNQPRGKGIARSDKFPKTDKDEADWDRAYEQLLKARPDIRRKVESGGATKQDVIRWMKSGGDKPKQKKRYPNKKVEVKDPAGFNRGRADVVYSGPQRGEQLRPFQVVELVGPRKGRTYDPVVSAGGKPQVLIFLDDSEVTIKGLYFLGMALDRVVTRSDGGLDVTVVFLGEDVSGFEPEKFGYIESAGKALRMTHTRDGREGPGAYGLNRKVAMTVVVAKDGKVLRNFAFVQPVFSPDPHVLGALAEVLGEDRDTLADWLNQAPADRSQMKRPNK